MIFIRSQLFWPKLWASIALDSRTLPPTLPPKWTCWSWRICSTTAVWVRSTIWREAFAIVWWTRVEYRKKTWCCWTKTCSKVIYLIEWRFLQTSISPDICDSWSQKFKDFFEISFSIFKQQHAICFYLFGLLCHCQKTAVYFCLTTVKNQL